MQLRAVALSVCRTVSPSLKSRPVGHTGAIHGQRATHEDDDDMDKHKLRLVKSDRDYVIRVLKRAADVMAEAVESYRGNDEALRLGAIQKQMALLGAIDELVDFAPESFIRDAP